MADDLELQETAAPRFPRPRKREAPSPYRARTAASPEAPPRQRPALVVRRPDPPPIEPVIRIQARCPFHDQTWTGRSPAYQIPWGLADRLFARLRPLRDLADDRPHVVALILVALLAIVFRVWAQSSVFARFGYRFL